MCMPLKGGLNKLASYYVKCFGCFISMLHNMAPSLQDSYACIILLSLCMRCNHDVILSNHTQIRLRTKSETPFLLSWRVIFVILA